ncbi:Acetyl esterase/lipase [Chryseobacterium soldanellicola]|uniref:Acetyl esterase/lipase n=2 Tax=Chryseobacterium soldanellicola TaxID=311333 RepID=A0A1H0ZYW6_9FLAO|nr:Acetyl esterase/lipase [Chryseobacterium soldanellicola]
MLLLFTIDCKEKPIIINKNTSFEVKKNISYGKDYEQKMDLYLPDSKNMVQKDIFIVIHGGGWRGGDKSQLTPFIFSMMEKFPNSIFVNLNYRLASINHFALPDQTDDITDVIHYLEKTLQYNPRVILLGNSAGGHLSMLYAYKFDKNKKVKAVVNIVGPADLSDPGFKNYEDYSFIEKQLIDPKILPQNALAMDFGSPTYWIDKNAPPTLSYYGKIDKVVPVSQKEILDSVFSKNNVFHESYEFNGGHVDWEKGKNSIFLINTIESFLKKVDKK